MRISVQVRASHSRRRHIATTGLPCVGAHRLQREAPDQRHPGPAARGGQGSAGQRCRTPWSPHQVSASVGRSRSRARTVVGPRRIRTTGTIVMRTLFGTLRLASPRWWHCGCQPQTRATFSPLAAMLPGADHPGAVLPAGPLRRAHLLWAVRRVCSASCCRLGRALHATPCAGRPRRLAQRLEDELGRERFSFIDTCQADREELPRPDLPLVVGLDGGYVHSSQQRSRRDGWFEVIAGKVMPADGRPACFGYVQTYDTKPKRRLFEVLKAQGMQANQQVTFLTDGGEDVRDLPRYLNPQAEHLLDWFHITMRLTVMTNMAKSLRPPPRSRPGAVHRGGRQAGQRGPRRPAAAEVVPLARQRLPRPDHHRGHHHRLGNAEPRVSEPTQAAQGGRRVRQLPSRQRRAHPQLRRTPPRRRGHLHRVRRVGGQPGDQQTY